MRTQGRRLAIVFLAVLAVVLGGVALAPGPTAANENVTFDVEITAPDAVDANDDLAVAVTLTNTGTATGTQNVTLSDGEGTELATTTVQLDPGESNTTTLTWENVPGDRRTVTPTVTSEDSVDTAVVTVHWAEFRVPEVDPETETILEGNSFDVSGTIENVGTTTGEQNVTLTVAGTEYAVEEDVRIESLVTETVSFGGVTPELDPGTYSYAIGTANDTASGTLTIQQRATFVVDSIEGSVQGEGNNRTAQVDAVVRNEGDVAGTQPVTFDVDNSQVDQRDVSLDAGETRDVRFTHQPGAFPINATVATEAPDAASVRVGGTDIEFGPEVLGVTPADVTLGDRIDVTYTADGAALETVRLRVEAPSGAVALEETVPEGIETDYAFNQTALAPYEAGAYNVTVEAEDEFGRTDSHTLPAAFEARSTVESGPAIEAVDPNAIWLNETVRVNYTAVATNVENVQVLLSGPDGEVALNRTVPEGVDRQLRIDPAEIADLERGFYDVTVQIRDVFGGIKKATRENALEARAEIEEGPAIERVEPEFVQLDDTLEINYTAVGRNLDSVHVLLSGPGGDVALDRTVPQGVNREHVIDPGTIDGLEQGLYDVTVQIRDIFGTNESATREEAFEAAPLYNPDDANFGETNYSTVAGDFVEVDVSLGGVDEALVLVGDGSRDDAFGLGGFLDVLHVSGSTSFVINTRLLGTDRPSGEVYVGGGGAVTSYAHDLGADQPPSGVFSDLRFETADYEPAAANLSALRRTVGTAQQRRPLQPATYSLAIGGGDSITYREDGTIDPRYPLDRATIELTEPELGNLTTYRLPTANADEASFTLDGEPGELSPGDLDGLLDRAVETDQLALGDRLLVELEANGLWGALADSLGESSAITDGAQPRLLSPRELREFLDLPEGVELTVAHANPGPNERQTGIDLLGADRDDVSVILDPYFGAEATETRRLYLLVDTRNPDPFETEPDDGETYVLNVSYSSVPGERYTYPETELGEKPAPFEPLPVPEGEQFPYLERADQPVTRSTNFTVNERVLSYDQTTRSGRPIVTTDPDATISGTTNLAPGSDLPIRLVIDVQDDPLTVEIDDVSITENGTFSVREDLSELDSDDQVVIQFWAYQELLDERRLALFEEVEQFSRFEITELDTESVVVNRTAEVSLSTIVENTGSFVDNATIELLVDGTVEANRTRRIEPGDTAAFNFPNATDDIGPGTYRIEVRTGDDLAGELLVVEETAPEYRIEEFAVSPSPADNATDVNVTARIRNAGTVRGDQPVEFLIDGEVRGERPTVLIPGDDVTAVFDHAVPDLAPGEYVLTIRTPDDNRSRPLVVEAAEDPDTDTPGSDSESGDSADNGDEGADGDGDTGGDDDSSEGNAPGDSSPAPGSGIVGVGAGSRAVVGGTAVVGAVYLLGYWV